jgi:diguanylate cyclase (GGDEF)-like protein
MLEEKEISITSLFNGSGISHPKLPSWLENQDFAEADLPYIQELLAESFSDWCRQTDGSPWLGGPVIVYHPDGSRTGARLAENGLSIDEGFLDKLTAEAVASARNSGKPVQLTVTVSQPADAACDVIAVPVMTRFSSIVCAVMACVLPGGNADSAQMKLLQSAALHLRSCLYRRLERMFISELILEKKISERAEARRNFLFEVLRRLHDHMEVEPIVSEMMSSLEHLYPSCRIDLYLSQDCGSPNDKVKPLAFHHEDMNLCKQAYLDGMLREKRHAGEHELAVPLTGKQGVYGVIRLIFREHGIDETDRDFITTLIAAAGAAFEKAKLHEHSNVLVGELRLINELAHRLNRSLELTETIQFACKELLGIFRADYCSIMQVNAIKKEFIVLYSNLAQEIGRTSPLDQGYAGIMWSTKEPIILSDYNDASQVKSHLMMVTGSRSLLAAPLMVNGEVIGVVMITHREPNYFSYDNYKLLQVISSHLGLALSNASLHAEVNRMVITDNLTGLFARHYLNERISRRQKRDSIGSLILLDIDHFKKVNDTYGHQIGDSILQQVSKIIQTSIRDGDIAARWGGEEMAIYLPEVGYEVTVKVAERIRSRVEKETSPRVTISCGLAEWRRTDDRISVESLFYRADMALYKAKHMGRNSIRVG